MALSGSTVFEVRTTGSDSNGGGFVTGSGGTDYSQQDAAQTAYTDIAILGTNTQISSAAHPFASTDVGNLIRITGGTGFTVGTYQVVSVAAAVATLDRAAGTALSVSGTGNLGGALFSPGFCAGVVNTAGAAGIIVYVKNGGSAFSITSASTNIASGCMAGTIRAIFMGYQTNRTMTNVDPAPTIQVNVSSATVAQSSALAFMNIIFDGNLQTSATASSNTSTFIMCFFQKFTSATINGQFFGCWATLNTAGIFAGGNTVADSCEAWANTATPFSAARMANCLSYNNTGATTDGFATGGGSQAIYSRLTAYGNGRHGITETSVGGGLVNCYAEGNAGFGFNFAGSILAFYVNCGAYNNTSGATTGTAPFTNMGFVTPTASVFVDPANGNFALNDALGGGFLLRAAGFPSPYPRGTTPNYIDIGAAQHINPPPFIPNLAGT